MFVLCILIFCLCFKNCKCANCNMVTSLGRRINVTLPIQSNKSVNMEHRPKQTMFYHQQSYRCSAYCPPAKQEEECHFCLETITKGQFMVFKLPCCGHHAHTECFKTRASHSHTESTVRCAYCRTTYRSEDTCFLCLEKYTEKLNCTMCCHTKVHTKCTADLTVLLSLLTYEHTLECGQLTNCNIVSG